MDTEVPVRLRWLECLSREFPQAQLGVAFSIEENVLRLKAHLKGARCNCGGALKKQVGAGEGVKHCVDCGAGWFILQTSRGGGA